MPDGSNFVDWSMPSPGISSLSNETLFPSIFSYPQFNVHLTAKLANWRCPYCQPSGTNDKSLSVSKWRRWNHLKTQHPDRSGFLCHSHLRLRRDAHAERNALIFHLLLVGMVAMPLVTIIFQTVE
jgi:hypothetical protein